jgi:hypothetical protein
VKNSLGGPVLGLSFLCLCLGVLFAATWFYRPTIANIRIPAHVHLIGAGANLGGGLMLLVLHFVLRRQG